MRDNVRIVHIRALILLHSSHQPAPAGRPGRDRMSLRARVQSPVALVLGIALTLVVPVLTLPHLPSLSPWPLVLGMVPWVVGKYVLCPLRWRTLTQPAPDGQLSRGWYLRAYAES